MTWRILMKDGEGQKYTSSALNTREEALSFACDLQRDGSLQIVKIENADGGIIELDEVALWCEIAKRERTTRGRA